MKKIREQFSKLQSDLRYKKKTKRVKVFFASICCAILIVFISIIGVIAGNNSENRYDADMALNSSSSAINDTSESDTTNDVSDSSTESKSEEIGSTNEETVDDGGVMPAESPDAGESYINETLFIGDSNTVRMMNYGITTEANTIAVVGMGIQSVKTLQCVQFLDRNEPVTMIEAVKLMQPRRIIITFGTNNATGMETSDFIKKYEEALAAIHDAYPYADILINAIPPICEKNSYPRLSQKSIDDFNAALVDMAGRLGYKFIDTASVMKNVSTGYAKDGFTVNDGIHLSDSGFAAMFTFIRTHSHIVEDSRPKPLASIPKQVKATYVIDGSGKMKNDPNAYKEMSEVSEAQKAALKAAQEEALKAAQASISNSSSSTAKCTHPSVSEMIIREATETQTGTKRYTCNNCGYIYDETIPKKQSSSTSTSTTTTTAHTHSWDSGTIITPATESAPGVKEYKCSCGQKRTETIPQLPPSSSSSETENNSGNTEIGSDNSNTDEVVTPPQEPTPSPTPDPDPPQDPEPEPKTDSDASEQSDGE